MTITTFGLNTTNNVQTWADAGIMQSLPNSVQGGNDRFYVSNTSGSQSAAVFSAPGLKAFFDTLGSVTINKVTLRLRRLNNVTAPSRNIQLRRLLVPFTEAQVTWNNRATGTPWQGAGVSGAGDADSEVLATALMPSSGGAYFAVTAPALATWLTSVISGAVQNHGFLVTLENPTVAGSGDFDLTSKERTDGQRPYLEIDYTPLTPPNITVDDVTVTNLSGVATFTISLSNSFPYPVTVYRKTTDDTATAPEDYTALPIALVTFAPGETEKTVDVSLVP